MPRFDKRGLIHVLTGQTNVREPVDTSAASPTISLGTARTQLHAGTCEDKEGVGHDEHVSEEERRANHCCLRGTHIPAGVSDDTASDSNRSRRNAETRAATVKPKGAARALGSTHLDNVYSSK